MTKESNLAGGTFHGCLVDMQTPLAMVFLLAYYQPEELHEVAVRHSHFPHRIPLCSHTLHRHKVILYNLLIYLQSHAHPCRTQPEPPIDQRHASTRCQRPLFSVLPPPHYSRPSSTQKTLSLCFASFFYYFYSFRRRGISLTCAVTRCKSLETWTKDLLLSSQIRGTW